MREPSSRAINLDEVYITSNWGRSHRGNNRNSGRNNPQKFAALSQLSFPSYLPEKILLGVLFTLIAFSGELQVCNSRHNSEASFKIHVGCLPRRGFVKAYVNVMQCSCNSFPAAYESGRLSNCSTLELKCGRFVFCSIHLF